MGVSDGPTGWLTVHRRWFSIEPNPESPNAREPDRTIADEV